MYRIKVSKDYLGFAAAHFITFRGHQCESLHGHNYRVAVELDGGLDAECHFVVDFGIVKRALRAEVDRLDHRVLLAAENPKLAFRDVDDAIVVEYQGLKTYQFPRRDCVLLPVANTTAELLAEWLSGRVWQELSAAGADLNRMELEVEESQGQSATFTRCASLARTS